MDINEAYEKVDEIKDLIKRSREAKVTGEVKFLVDIHFSQGGINDMKVSMTTEL